MYTALRATSATLAGFLRRQFLADPALGATASFGGALTVSISSPEEMTLNTRYGLSVWLYHVQRDEQRLNDPPRREPPDRLIPAPLPLRLRYLVTPLLDRSLSGSDSSEQQILGKVLQVFHDYPLLRGADLLDDFANTDVELRLRLENLGLEDLFRIWEPLDRSYQLSISYEVSVVYIESARQPERGAPVRIFEPEYGLIVGRDL